MKSKLLKNINALALVADGYLLTTPLWFIGVISSKIKIIALNKE